MPQVFLSAKSVAMMALEGVAFSSTGVPRIYEVTKERLKSDKNVVLDSWAAHTSAPARL